MAPNEDFRAANLHGTHFKKMLKTYEAVKSIFNFFPVRCVKPTDLTQS